MAQCVKSLTAVAAPCVGALVHVPACPPPIQLPVNDYGTQHGMAQMLGPPPPTAEAQTDLLAPGFCPAPPQLWQAFRKWAS